MKIREFQDAARDHLNAVEELVKGNCKAISEDSLSILKELPMQLQTARGVALVVATPEIRRVGSSSPKGFDCETSLVINCFELPALNRLRANAMTAMDAAAIVARSLEDEATVFESIRETADQATGSVKVAVTFSTSIYLT